MWDAESVIYGKTYWWNTGKQQIISIHRKKEGKSLWSCSSGGCRSICICLKFREIFIFSSNLNLWNLCMFYFECDYSWSSNFGLRCGKFCCFGAALQLILVLRQRPAAVSFTQLLELHLKHLILRWVTVYTVIMNKPHVHITPISTVYGAPGNRPDSSVFSRKTFLTLRCDDPNLTRVVANRCSISTWLAMQQYWIKAQKSQRCSLNGLFNMKKSWFRCMIVLSHRLGSFSHLRTLENSFKLL